MDAFLAQVGKLPHHSHGHSLFCGGWQESSHSLIGSLRYSPYDKDQVQLKVIDSFWEGRKPTLCLWCGALRHRASNCYASKSSHTKQLINCEWKEEKLVSKSNKTICILFNIGSICTEQPSPSHNIHSCSLCNDRNHPACCCTRN